MKLERVAVILKSVFRPIVDLPQEMRCLVDTSDDVVIESRRNVEVAERVAESSGLSAAVDEITGTMRG